MGEWTGGHRLLIFYGTIDMIEPRIGVTRIAYPSLNIRVTPIRGYLLSSSQTRSRNALDNLALEDCVEDQGRR